MNCLVKYFLIFFILASGCSQNGTNGQSQKVIIEIPVDNLSTFSLFNRNDYPITNTFDKDLNTFMTTPTLNLGDVVEITYKLKESIYLSKVSFWDNYTKNYNLGNLTVLASSNSTDGVNGDWSVVKELSTSTNVFKDGEGTISFDAVKSNWVKLRMSYQGSGAYGSTPSFYLTEIKFFGYLL